MTSILKPHLLSLSPYQPPLEGRDALAQTLLDFNERTIPVVEPIAQALCEFIQAGRLQQYPAYGNVVERLADYAGVQAKQLMITNGSDQGIDLVFRAVSREHAQAIIPGPSFAMYDQCAKVEGMEIIAPHYSKDQGYPLDDVLNAINEQTAIVVIANPNNPSGTLLDVDSIARIASKAPHAAILVDECYFEYARCTCVPLLIDHENLFIARTFSKTWGIPSLRFGYLMAHPRFIHALCNVRGPYDINQLAIVAAHAALDHPDSVNDYVTEVMNQAKPLFEDWLMEQNIDYWPSAANFVWTFPEDAQAIADHLATKSILVRPKAFNERLGLRISVGTHEQMWQLIRAWAQFSLAS